MSAIFKREFKSYFSSPLGYVVLSALMFFSGLFFVYMFSYGVSDISYVFTNMFTIVMFAVPILTMRLMSEDRKQKTDQALLTAPVSLWGIVGGKFLAAYSIYALGFAPTLIYEIILAFQDGISLNVMMYISSLLGVMLYGGALIAVGLFISSLTESQVIAAVVGIVVSLLISLMDSFAAMIENEFFSNLVTKISFTGRYEAFATGVMDFSNVIFFASVMFIFMFLSVRSLDKKRWA